MSEVPPEFSGMARVFLGAVTEDDHRACAALLALRRPVVARFRRQPYSGLRDGTLRDLWRQWEAIPRRFRLAMNHDIDRRGRRGMIEELHLAPCNLTTPDWVARERSTLVGCWRLQVDKNALIWEPHEFGVVGHHALGRRFQRGRDRAIEAVVADLLALALTDINDTERFPEGAPFRIAAGDGFWLGETATVEMMSDHAPEAHVQFVVRTYIDRDQ
jgi:hypothetical protein